MRLPKTRMKVKERLAAFRLMQALRNQTNRKNWHVGVTSYTHIFLDLDKHDITAAENLAKWVVKCTKDEVAIFRTDKGYWIVTKHGHDNWTRNGLVYRPLVSKDRLRKKLGLTKENFDIIHAKLSIKYGKSTLRVSLKEEKFSPTLVEILRPHSNKTPYDFQDKTGIKGAAAWIRTESL